MKARLANHDGIVVVGPRSAAKTRDGQMPVPLPPDLPGLDVTVAHVESIPPGVAESLEGGGSFIHWVEHLDTTEDVVWSLDSGSAALVRKGGLHYLAGDEAGIERAMVPNGLRLRDTKTHRFAFNYSPVPIEWNDEEIAPGGVAWWKL